MVKTKRMDTCTHTHTHTHTHKYITKKVTGGNVWLQFERYLAWVSARVPRFSV